MILKCNIFITSRKIKCACKSRNDTGSRSTEKVRNEAAVTTRTLSLAFLSAPLAINNRTQSMWPSTAAKISAVRLCCARGIGLWTNFELIWPVIKYRNQTSDPCLRILFSASLSAPLSISSRTQSVRPLIAAHASAVDPFCITHTKYETQSIHINTKLKSKITKMAVVQRASNNISQTLLHAVRQNRLTINYSKLVDIQENSSQNDTCCFHHPTWNTNSNIYNLLRIMILHAK